jgi:nucleoid-associated protein YgaU
VIHDASYPHSYSRSRPANGRRQRLALAAAAAIAGLLLAGGVAYGGSATSGERIVVRQGDTLWGIAAAHYGGSAVQARIAQIEAANQLRSAALKSGQTLILPPP